ncbi:MAG TPA: hypothetical protein VFB34_00430, partial [Chloroflexota bacterium]|nr:hypothetical protein [Chloroflexota bacterium]
APVVAELLRAPDHFTWDRFLMLLVGQFGLESATFKDLGFNSGSSLIIGGKAPLTSTQYPLRPLVAWISECEKRDPQRIVFQMKWEPEGDVLIYQRDKGRLVLQSGQTARRIDLADSGMSLEEMDNWERVSIPVAGTDSSRLTIA